MLLKHHKAMGILIFTSIFFQGCRIYSDSITINEAKEHFNEKVKVKTFSGKVYKFEKILVKDSTVEGFSIKRSFGKIERHEKYTVTVLNVNEIEKIKLVDKETSGAITLGIIGVIITAFTIFICVSLQGLT